MTAAPTPNLDRARIWAREQALPLWADIGIDPSTGGFCERLSAAGAPIADVPHRVMVQCRQISVYALADTMGWWKSEALIARAVDHLVRSYWAPDGRPGWIFSTDRSGRPVDRRRDTYAHAFVLFALGWAYRITPDPRLLTLADETLAFVDEGLQLGGRGGLVDGDVRADQLRRQNPHMHFLEAMLSLASGTGRERYLARAGEIFGLFSTRFIDAKTGGLLEYFDDDWEPLAGPLAVCEPGHELEWVWLLRRFEAMTGRSVERYTASLYDHAWRHGVDRDGFIVDEVTPEGLIKTASRRSWPHAEAVKASAIEHEAGRAGCLAQAEHVLGKLLDHYLAGPFPGGWIDHFDEHGRPLVDYVPASSLYHLFFAVAEADRVFGGATGRPAG